MCLSMLEHAFLPSTHADVGILIAPSHTNAYCKEQALHIAARDGDLECVKVLVAAGADAKAVTTAGK